MSDPARPTTHRRGFIGRLGAAAALGFTGLAGFAPATHGRTKPGVTSPLRGAADPSLDAWLERIKGTHKIVFDSPAPHGGLPAVWPRVYLLTLDQTYPGAAKDATAVLVLRHESAALGLQDAMWAKYPFGEDLKIEENGKPARRNIYADIKGLPLPDIGVTRLIDTGVLVGVCNMALTVDAAAVAKKTGGDAAKIHQDWVDHLLPGVQLVPSGVLAVGLAQEKGANYCFAG